MRAGARAARWALLCCAWSLALCGLGCKPRTEPAPAVPTVAGAAAQAAAAAAPAARPAVFLWKAQLGPSTVYFLGSVHVARAQLYPLDPRIEAAFNGSDTLVLELDLNAETQLAVAQRMLELGKLPAGKKLEEVVQPQTWQLLRDAEQRRGVSLFGLRGFRPWFVALALTSQALEKAGYSAEQGIDEHFRQQAEGRQKVAALETVEEQLSLFTQLSPVDAELLLRQTLEELDQYGEQLDASFELWKAGDAAQLDQLLLGPMRGEYPLLFSQLFLERNQRMLARLELLAKQPGRYFVVVGAGHLVGAGGIVDLLRARGIVAEQL